MTLQNIQSWLNEGKISQSLIDESNLRLLRQKLRFGFINNPDQIDGNNNNNNNNNNRSIIACEEHQEVALEAARKSIVLLQNNDHFLLLKNLQNIKQF